MKERFKKNLPLAMFTAKKMWLKMRKYFEYDEVYQICMIGLWKACMNFNGDERQWCSFACICMRNECSNEKRMMFETKGTRVYENMSSLDLKNEDKENVFNPSVTYDFDKKIVSEEIKSKVLKLTSTQKKILFERFWNDKKVVDIAKELNCSKTNVNTVIKYAKERLRVPLKKYI